MLCDPSITSCPTSHRSAATTVVELLPTTQFRYLSSVVTRNGLTIGANYTFAHGLDNVLSLSNEINDGYGTIPSQMSTLDYGNSDLDIRSRGVVAINYALPFGHNLTGITGVLAKGWAGKYDSDLDNKYNRSRSPTP